MLRSFALLAVTAGLGPAACLADPMVPCGAFEPGRVGDDAASNTIVRAYEGPLATLAMRTTVERDGELITKGAFVLRNLCDGPDGECHVDKLTLDELSPGSQVMLTTDGRYLVGIDHDHGGVWTYQFDEHGNRISKTA